MLLKVSVSRSTMTKVGLAFCFTFTTIAVVVTLYSSEVISENLVDFYENLIISESQKALIYEQPVDASRYRAQDNTVSDFGSYDFIIIGAGSTGAVIANRLSEEEYWKVLLLEAGTFPNNFTEIPALYALGCFSDYNWGFKSIPQTTACLGTVDQRCAAPRGRGLGGTTLINGLVYSRGHATDYNRWAELVNDRTWSYENVFPYFKISENFHATDQEAAFNYAYHGTEGYWNVEHHLPSNPLKYVFLDANAELGYNFTDYNGPEHQEGGAVIQYNTNMGKRHDQGTAFILPVLYRENLRVSTESYVIKVEIDEVTKVWSGVLFTHQGRTYRATAGKEIIISAGAISSPQILMLSGIGPQEHLEELSIPVIQNLSVGVTLREHTGVFGLQFSSNVTAPKLSLRDEIKAYLNGTGYLTSNTQSHVIGWHRSGVGDAPSPDLELVLDLSEDNSEFGKKFLNWNDETWNALWGDHTSSFYISMVLLHAQSTGSVKLNSSNPFDYPLIDYNLLSDPRHNDIDALYEGINFCFELINTTAFRKIGAKFESRSLPACSNFEYLSKDYWYCYIRQLSAPVFHSVGTCPMGTDPLRGAVVDSYLRVFGVRNLRVADASVFPFTLSSHSSADCAVIGEKISGFIKLDHIFR